MKKILISLLLAFSMTALAKDITVAVKGMVCGFCAQGITKKFKELPSVENVDVSLEKKTVIVKTKSDQDVPDKLIKEILTDSGYNVEEIKR